MKEATIGLLQVTVATIGVFVAIIVHLHRRYTIRRNVATALINEIENHRKDLNGIQPHIDEKQFKEPKTVTGSNGSQWRFFRYKPGYVPAPSRMLSESYEGNTERVAAFKQDSVKMLSDYYADVYYVRELLQDTHEGQWMPPAAFSLLDTKMDELRNDSEKVIEHLETEKEKFRTKETLKNYLNRFSQLLARLKHYMALCPGY